MEAEEYFKEKFGNDLKSNDSWVIRFAQEYAEHYASQQLPTVSDSLIEILNEFIANNDIGAIEKMTLIGFREKVDKLSTLTKSAEKPSRGESMKHKYEVIMWIPVALIIVFFMIIIALIPIN